MINWIASCIADRVPYLHAKAGPGQGLLGSLSSSFGSWSLTKLKCALSFETRVGGADACMILLPEGQ